MTNAILNLMYSKEVGVNLTEMLELNSMNATEKIAVILKLRGLFVSYKKNVLVFSNSSTNNDIRDVIMLLNNYNIPFIHHEKQKIEILVNFISLEKMKQLFFAGGKPFPINYINFHSNWRSFVSRKFGYRVNAYQLEHNVACLVKAANLAGLSTYAGCNGHSKKSPRLQFTGPIMGAWFEVIQQLFMVHHTFNYQWEVTYSGLTGAELRATSKGKWNQMKIHEDTLKMAMILESHAAEIRELKKLSFRKSHKEIVAGWIEIKNYSALKEWMLRQVQEVQYGTGIVDSSGKGA
ncbi:hypothetical protein MKZ20_14780 [Psychrobacillus sp. FSL K6-2684]|uniref:hypothetical protein n=1 Tax=Psychrobacillus sp. FSL K6-2684 TaxID=2921547 RepID=UPI0030F4E538